MCNCTGTGQLVNSRYCATDECKQFLSHTETDRFPGGKKSSKESVAKSPPTSEERTEEQSRRTKKAKS